MASALIFSSEEALLAALTSNMLPADVRARPVYYRRAENGAIWVCPDRPIGTGLAQQLRRVGVTTKRRVQTDEFSRARFWPQIIPPRPIEPPARLLVGSATRSPARSSIASRVSLSISSIDVYAERTVLFAIESASPNGRDGGRVAVKGASGRDVSGSLLDLSAELLRLGCDRCSYQLFGVADGPPGDATASANRAGPADGPAELALLRAFSPPYYTVARAGDRDSPYRAFAPVASGQTRRWIELGYSHPMASSFEPPAGHIGLITGDGRWLDVADGPWHDMFDFVEVAMPEEPANLVPIRPQRKLTVTLTLAAASRTELPSLWVLYSGYRRAGDNPIDPIGQMDTLVHTLPNDVINRLLFTVLDRPGQDQNSPIVVLRARHGRSGPPTIDVEGIAMVPFMGMANLYVPHDAIVEPPLRRDMLRELLAPDDVRLYWLSPLAPASGRDNETTATSQTGPDRTLQPSGRRFRVDSAPDRAFSPLSDWVEYLVHKNAEELSPWVRSVTFEFESFQSVGMEWDADPDALLSQRRGRRDRRRERSRSQPGPGEQPSSSPARERRDTPIPIELPADRLDGPGEPESHPYSPSAAELALAELERAFLDSDGPADHPSRTDMWLTMARLLGQLDRRRDASLCFVRALWELPVAAAASVAAEWWSFEATAMQSNVAPGELAWLALSDSPPPTTDYLRAIAVHWIAVWLAGAELGAIPDAAHSLPGRPVDRGPATHAVQQWFDANDAPLDVRTSWLLRCALAAQVGGDPLGLARTRDRILRSLRGGLSLERDVPTFLRFLRSDGGTGIGDSVAVAPLVDRLESLLPLFDSTLHERSPVEAPLRVTRAYVQLVMAYGLARLGQGERARRMREEAALQLDISDRIHAFLAAAYAARIDQALEGLPPETPLPPELAATLNELNATERYKVDRLRQLTTILEPQERLDSIDAFLNRREGENDMRGPEFTALRGMTDAAGLSRAIDELLDRAMDPVSSAEDRQRLCDGIMDFLPMLPDSQALPVLRAIVDGAAEGLPPLACIQIFEEALMIAGYFGWESLADELAQAIAGLVGDLPAEEVGKLAEEFGRCLRSLRRVGLRDRAARLIDVLRVMLTGDDLNTVTARVHLAAGLAYLGDFEQAQPMLRSAQSALQDMEYSLEGVPDLVHALATGWSLCPQEHAFAGLEHLASELGRVKDKFSTNSHFSLSTIAFMEALVLGYARSDLALGELGRRWLDEDEYLVRRRIHRDIGVSS